jgi:hypothetical protein
MFKRTTSAKIHVLTHMTCKWTLDQSLHTFFLRNTCILLCDFVMHYFQVLHPYLFVSIIPYVQISWSYFYPGFTDLDPVSKNIYRKNENRKRFFSILFIPTTSSDGGGLDKDHPRQHGLSLVPTPMQCTASAHTLWEMNMNRAPWRNNRLPKSSTPTTTHDPRRRTHDTIPALPLSMREWKTVMLGVTLPSAPDVWVRCPEAVVPIYSLCSSPITAD